MHRERKSKFTQFPFSKLIIGASNENISSKTKHANDHFQKAGNNRIQVTLISLTYYVLELYRTSITW